MFGAQAADRPLHPVSSVEASSTTDQLGVPGPWHQRLPHFGLDFLPSVGAELQSEYFVARADAVPAIVALREIGDRIDAPLLISEIRTIAADTFWMSPCYGEDCVALHFTFKPDWDAVRPVLTAIEDRLAPFAVRPHWGKLFTMPAAEVKARYPRLGDFQALCRRLDPDGKFRNAFLDDYVF
jgi:xylitol oxidase